MILSFDYMNKTLTPAILRVNYWNHRKFPPVSLNFYKQKSLIYKTPNPKIEPEMSC